VSITGVSRHITFKVGRPNSRPTRHSSRDDIANVNFFYHDIVHTHPLQNTIDSCINSATDRSGYVSEHRFNKFSEITQCNGHYAIRSFKVTDFGTN